MQHPLLAGGGVVGGEDIVELWLAAHCRVFDAGGH